MRRLPSGISAATIALAMLFVAMLPSRAQADPRIRYQELNWNKAGYDYAPSVLWDGAQWIMYHCGFYAGTNSDAIFRSTSADGVNWTAPQVVLTIGGGGAWDSAHVCDPSVLKGVSVAGYSWAMWYTGVAPTGGLPGPNSVGLALSNDGISWVKYGGNPVIDCRAVDGHYWGCGQPSAVKVVSTYYLSHTEIVPGFTGNRARTSSDGLSWTSGTTFTLPTGDVGADFMYSNGTWYSTVGSSQSGGPASDLRVYTSASMEGSKTLVGILTYGETGHRFVAEGGFYRSALGTQLASDIWIAFGLGDVQLHDPSEDIKSAKLAIMDAEQGTVDSLLGGYACSAAGPSITPPQFAWSANGPSGDDINYWTMTSDGNGINDYCDIRLSNLPNPDFSAGSRLQITWYGWSTTGSRVGMDVYFLSNGVYTYLGLIDGVQNTLYVNTLNLPAQRSNVGEILFRAQESFFTNLWQSGQQMRLHLFSVKLIN